MRGLVGYRGLNLLSFVWTFAAFAAPLARSILRCDCYAVVAESRRVGG